MNLTPLKEIEPTPEEIARVRRRAAEPASGRRRRPALAIAAVAATAAVVAALPGANDATSALRAAAAAAAEQPGPADFTGYRYVEMIDRGRSHWATFDEDCMRRRGLPKPATPGAKPEPSPCPVTRRATYSSEGRQEIWVDADWRGTRRDHGSRVTAASGDPELAEAIRRELVRERDTDAYVYGEGPFAHAPLAELPTDPDELLRTLTAAFEDGRWAEGGTFDWEIATEDVRRFALARYVAHLLAEANATPALRSAAFGVLSRMEGVADLGGVEDSEGRRGHGIEIRGRTGPAIEGTVPARLRVIFDPGKGDVLSWGEYREDEFREFVLLATDHVSAKP